ncbi:hypothetical protein MSG28_006635 [Choristoneura fumiferana]|uniref:Uncharacterized protein n=1 Tax=Choristoneura fumiferana TaxID=7141 RepID=A0ACC0JKL7_CHOFU|nr:hypothetical protein MSG28_006635 [Choristoneura fumiferana]
MSNQYYGWGGEDDDFYSRLENKEIKICRFEPATSVYYMLNHKPELKGTDNRWGRKVLEWRPRPPTRWTGDIVRIAGNRGRPLLGG